MNVTYLLGAGASFDALPIVEKIPNALNEVIQKLKNDFSLESKEIINRKYKYISDTDVQIKNKLIMDLEWLKLESSRHSSIDTFAKKLYLTYKREDTKRLKIALSIFFTIYQIDTFGKEKRYDSFLASIFQNERKFPKEVRMLSWNYDNQFEIAISDYFDSKNINSLAHDLNMLEKYAIPYPRREDYNFLFKLNGTCGFIEEDLKKNFLNDLKLELNIDSFYEILENYAKTTFNKTEFKSTLSFSWEVDSDSFIQEVNQQLNGTEILVIIGYSFPYFNREVDRKIINSMPNLNKVYFQSPEANELVERFQAITDRIDNSRLIPISDLKQFYIPNEM